MDAARFCSQRVVLITGTSRCARSCLALTLEQCGLTVADLRYRHGRMQRFAQHSQRLNSLLTTLQNQQHVAGGPDLVKIRRLAELRRVIIHVLQQLPQPVGLSSVGLLHQLESWRRSFQDQYSHFLQRQRRQAHSPAIDPAASSSVDAATLSLPPQVLVVGTFCSPGLPSAVYDPSSRKASTSWAWNHQQLLDVHLRNPFPLIEFDLNQPGLYAEAVLRLAGEFGLQHNRTEVLRFAERLRGPRPSDTSARTSVEDRLYQYFRHHSIQQRLRRPLLLPPTWLHDVAQTDRTAYLTAQHSPLNASFRVRPAS